MGEIQSNSYARKVLPEFSQLTKSETKAVLMMRFGMLECGSNFKGSLGEKCSDCQVTDDVNHRIYFCKKWAKTSTARFTGPDRILILTVNPTLAKFLPE